MPEQVLRGSRATHLSSPRTAAPQKFGPRLEMEFAAPGLAPSTPVAASLSEQVSRSRVLRAGKAPHEATALLPGAQHLPPHSPLEGAQEWIQAPARGLPGKSTGHGGLPLEGRQLAPGGGAGAGFAPSELPRWDCREQSLPRPGEHPASSRSLSGPRCALRALTAGSSLAGSPPSRALALSSSWPSQRELRRHTIDLCVGLNHFYLVCHHGSFAEKAASLPREAGSGGRL